MADRAWQIVPLGAVADLSAVIAHRLFGSWGDAYRAESDFGSELELRRAFDDEASAWSAGGRAMPCTFVAVDASDGPLKGVFMGCCSLRSHWLVAHLEDVFVEEHDRGKGLGSALVRHAIAHLRASLPLEDELHLWIKTAASADPASDSSQLPRFYGRLGFAPDGTERRGWRRMTLRLQPVFTPDDTHATARKVWGRAAAALGRM